MRPRAALAVFLAVGALAGAAVAEPAPAWRLLQVFQPQPGLQRGLDVWLSEADLTAAAASKSDLKTVRALVRGPLDASGAAAEWSLSTVRYDCRRGRATRVSSVLHRRDGSTASERGGGSFQPIPHTPDAFIFGVVCNGVRLDGARTAATVEQALAIDAELDKAFAAGQAEEARLRAEAALKPPEPPTPPQLCERTRTTNILFADVVGRAPGAPGAAFWKPAGGEPVWGQAGEKPFGYATLAASPSRSQGLVQDGRSIPVGRWTLSLLAADVGKSPVKLRAVVRAGAPSASDAAGPGVAVVETPTLPGSAFARYTFDLHLAAPADTIAVYAVPAGSAAETGFASVTLICLDPR
jgi:hypothetical protein